MLAVHGFAGAEVKSCKLCIVMFLSVQGHKKRETTGMSGINWQHVGGRDVGFCLGPRSFVSPQRCVVVFSLVLFCFGFSFSFNERHNIIDFFFFLSLLHLLQCHKCSLPLAVFSVCVAAVLRGRGFPDGQPAAEGGTGVQQHGALPHQAVQFPRGRYRRGQGG